MVGVLVLFLSFHFTQAARKEMIPSFWWTVYTRPTIILFFAAFVLLGFARAPLILFGAVDLLGAIWTGLALRSSRVAWAR